MYERSLTIIDSANFEEDHKLTDSELADRDSKFKSLLDEPLEGETGRLIKKGIQALLDEPIEDDKSVQSQQPQHPKKPDIKSMLEAARKAKEAASREAAPTEELEIPSDIPRHHFELEDSQAFFDMTPGNRSQTKPQKQAQPQVPPQPVPSAQPQGGFPFLGAAVPQTRSWFYRDPKGNEQGPFSSAQMEKWLNAKYFTIDLDVRSSEDIQYVPLVMHFLREQRNPFSGVPLQQWLAVPSLSEFQANVVQVCKTRSFKLIFSTSMPSVRNSFLSNSASNKCCNLDLVR